MTTTQPISRTTLARQTRQVLQSVLRGNTVIVESHGQPEVAIIDIDDYYLLQGALQYHSQPPAIDPQAGLDDPSVAALPSREEQVALVIGHYLAGAISLARAAELLEMPGLVLRTRLLRLAIPVRSAPDAADDLLNDLADADAFA